MDNRSIDIVSEGDEDLALAVKLIWSNAPDAKATHYKVARVTQETSYHGNPTSWHDTRYKEDPKGVPTLILLRSAEAGALPLPYPLGRDEAIAFITGWLRQAEFGPEPDHDGDNYPGWHAFTNLWGHVAGHHYGIVGVQPTWSMHGK
jgi:hypothetical protein